MAHASITKALYFTLGGHEIPHSKIHASRRMEGGLPTHTDWEVEGINNYRYNHHGIKLHEGVNNELSSYRVLSEGGDQGIPPPPPQEKLVLHRYSLFKK